MSFIEGKVIKTLREQRRLTQRELADRLSVSDKTVSKWETGRGLPDITIIPELSQTLGVSVAELMTGNVIQNNNHCANMLKTLFYVCPICGNIISSVGEGSFSCCGISLPYVEAEESDEDIISVSRIGNEYNIIVNHEMSKSHYISFIAYVTCDSSEIKKLYPEQNAEVNFTISGHGKIYAYCNRHGLYEITV